MEWASDLVGSGCFKRGRRRVIKGSEQISGSSNSTSFPAL